MSLLGLLLVWVSAVHAVEAPAPKGVDLSQARLIPVLSGGRVKPLDSYAREVALFVTGKRNFQGWDPVELLLSWVAHPDLWETTPSVQVSLQDVKRQIGVDEKRVLFSSHELIHKSELGQYANNMGAPNAQAMQVGMGGVQKADPREKELRAVVERISLFHAVVSGDAWPLIPSTGADAWKAISSVEASGEAELRKKIGMWLVAYRKGEKEAFANLSRDVRESVEARVTEWPESSPNSVRAEVFYNAWHPFRMAWVIYLIAALGGVAGFALAKGYPKQARVANGVLLVGAALGQIVHVGGMAIRSYIAQRPPVTNMYESVIWVSFGAVLFAWILYGVTKQKVLIVVASVAAALSLIIADSAPAVMDPSIHPLVPVLRSNFWLTIHVMTITLGYAAFMLTLMLGNVALFHYLMQSLGRGAKDVTARILNLNQLSYRATQFGVVLLAAGTILGGIWADYSWGRFWGWDPKEVWALIALLGYLAILHARYTGWMGQFGFAAWNVIAFNLVVMAWYGVNFVLGVGLHSYGFSTGGQGTVATYTVLQLSYVAAVALLQKRGAAKRLR